MADSLPTVWPLEPHTRAKHVILRGYLDAWIPILSRSSAGHSRVLYVDGFAGPGVYEGGEDGSPVIAIRAALEHAHDLPVPIRMLFVEARRDRFERLEKVLAPFKGQRPDRVRLAKPMHAECASVLYELMDKNETSGQRFGPALVFLDQFGYAEVPLDLIRKIMAHEQCEAFTYLDAKGINRFLEDESKWPAITRAYGSDVWKAALAERGPAKFATLASEYEKALRQHAGHVVHFAMYGTGDNLLYWLFYCTHSLKGLEVMKRAMWKVAPQGDFRFSDRDAPGQLRILSGHDDGWLGDHLSRKLDGRTMLVSEIEEYVLIKTPSYKYKAVLGQLERDARLEVVDPPPGRTRGSFPKDLRVRFGRRQQLLF